MNDVPASPPDDRFSITGTGFELSASQRELLALADDLGRTRFAVGRRRLLRRPVH